MSPIPSNTDTHVFDDETLYRAVRSGPRIIIINDDGSIRISSMAFNDARRRPSVDRAILCPDGPRETQKRFSPDSGVLSFSAYDVRSITTKHGVTGEIYCVDIEAVPLEDNPSHAEIFGWPPFDTDKVFDRIKQALCRIAVVALPPSKVTSDISISE